MDRMSVPHDSAPRNSIRLSEEQKMEILKSLNIGDGVDGNVKLPKDKKISVTLSPDGTHAQVCYDDVCRVCPIIQKGTSGQSEQRKASQNQADQKQSSGQPEQPTKNRTFSRTKSQTETSEIDSAQSIQSSTAGPTKEEMDKIRKSPSVLKKVSTTQSTPPRKKKSSSSILEGLYKKKKTPSLVFSYSEEMEDKATGQNKDSEDYKPLKHWDKDGQSLNMGSTNFERPNFDSQFSQSTQFTLGLPKDNFDTASMRSGTSRRTIQSIEEIEEIKQAKRQRFWDFFTMVSSMTYAVVLIIIGISTYIMDIFVSNANKHHVSEWFNLYLSIVGAVGIIFLLLDIQHYITSITKYRDMDHFTLKSLKLVEGDDGELHIDIPLPEAGGNLPEYYAFSTGRHSGSFFLKIGACVFCFGHTIHMLLNIVKQTQFIGKVVQLDKVVPLNNSLCTLDHNDVFLSSNESTIVNCSECTAAIFFAFEVAYPIFSWAQLYMIFKFSNVIVNRRKYLARFVFMHCIGACLCFWVYTIIDETLAALVSKYFHAKLDCKDYKSSVGAGDDILDIFLAIIAGTDVTKVRDYIGGIETSYGGGVGASYKAPECYAENSYHFNFDNSPSCVIVRREECNGKEDSLASNIADTAQPLLFPFSIEFSILVVAVWYIMWSNIGKVEENLHSIELLPSVSNQGSQEDLHRTSGHKDAMIMYANCASSNRGLFIGFIFCAASLCIVIVYFFMQNDCPTLEQGEWVIDITEWVIYFFMIIISIIAYVNIVKLEVNPHPISLLDDMLLFVCIPCFALYALICFVPVFFMENNNENRPRIIITHVLTLTQVLIQTPLIIDGLRRCSDSEENQKKMPGRNTVMLLIVVNLTVYLFEIFTLMAPVHQEEFKSFYGITPWTILLHIAMPLCIFYRFHSAVALVDIWNSAYKPSEHH